MADSIALALAARLPVSPPTVAWTSILANQVPYLYNGQATSTDGTRVFISQGVASNTGADSGVLQVLQPNGTVVAGTFANTPLHFATATNLGGKHYQLGGYTNSGAAVVNNMSVYTPAGTDGASGTWAYYGMPQSLMQSNATTDGRYVYVVGGYYGTNTTQVTDSGYRYDPQANSWTSLPALPSPRAQGALVYYSGALYYLGGSVSVASGVSGSATVFVYTIATGTWSTATSLPMQLGGSGISATVYGSGAYLLYGNSLYRYDFATGTLATSGPDLAPPLYSHSSYAGLVTTTSGIVATGAGFMERLDPSNLAAYPGKVKAVQQYLAATNTLAYAASRKLPATAPANLWDTALPALPATRNYAAGAAVGNIAYLFGGNVAGVVSTSCISYNLATGTTGAIASLVGSAAYSVAGFAGARSDGRIIVGGGGYAGQTTQAGPLSGYEITNNITAYSTTANTSTACAALPAARVYAQAVMDSANRVLVVGGQGGAQSPGTALGTIVRYEYVANQWTTLAGTMGTVRSQGAAAIDSAGRVYYAGGILAAGGFSGVTERWDPTTSTWTTLTAMPTACYGGTATMDSAGRLFLSPASGASSTSVPAQRYDPGTNTWAVLASQPLAGSYGHVMVRDTSGRLVFLGGAQTVSPYAATASVYRLTPEAPYSPGVVKALAALAA